MIRFLLARPIAVSMIFIALVVFSIITFKLLPISLLPPIDVPQIVVKVKYPNASPEAIEQNALLPIREQLLTLSGLTYLDSKAASEAGTVRLNFEYGTRMDLAYIEVNEKIDRLTNQLPRDLDRPQVIRVNTNDIPVVRLQIVPKSGADLYEVSLLAENVLKKRIEQLKGVSLVDINGSRQRMISIRPKKEMMAALGIQEKELINAIRQGNEEFPGISVAEGQYRYYLRMATRVEYPEDILKLPVLNAEGMPIPLERLAEVKYELIEPMGFHLFGTQEALVLTVHKQASAKMNELVPDIYSAMDQFVLDFPQLDFDITQDQSVLLNAGIDNLTTSLLFGGLFAFAVLFLFMGNFRTPMIIGISLPTSLLISFMVFYFFNISINIISLSGLALGLGMLIDNSIIVLDNISRKIKEGLGLFDACVEGVNEVMSALISSVLTTLAVFIPLVFLSGISGALFYDQAVAVAAILSVSLLVAFVLLPMLYWVFARTLGMKQNKEDSAIYLKLRGLYKRSFEWVYARKKMTFWLGVVLIPVSLGLTLMLPTSGLPPIQKFDAVVEINWNEPIPVQENKDRVVSLLGSLQQPYIKTESDIGLRQFLLFDGESSIQQATLYFLFESENQKEVLLQELRSVFAKNFVGGGIEIKDAPNAFDQLFAGNLPFYEVRMRDLASKRTVPEAQMNQWLSAFPTPNYSKGFGLQEESAVVFRLDQQALSRYGISPMEAQEMVKKLFGNYVISDIKKLGEITPIRLKNQVGDFNKILLDHSLRGKSNATYALSNFVEYDYVRQYKYLTADRSGIFQSLILEEKDPEKFKKEILQWGLDKNLGVEFFGQYFLDKERIRELMVILGIAILLLYFILAAQFESFVQPLIVIMTLPLGIGGAMLVLLLTGTTLNIMSAIGLVVMLGIMVNDAILKIDTSNRLYEQYLAEMSASQALQEALKNAGEIRLKPILMTSLTTILALLPIIFSSGLGADLQRPLVYSVLGGLTLGTFTAIYFVPLAYHFIGVKARKSDQSYSEINSAKV